MTQFSNINNLNDLKQTIIDNGLSLNDERLHLNELENNILDNGIKEKELIIEEINKNLLIQKMLQGNLVIPEWSNFCKEIVKIYDKIKHNNEGKGASYIPQLAKADPNLFCISVITIDGQIFEIGDDVSFSVQSCSKPITYGIAVETEGEEYVHNFVGREPSGRNFNELCLNSESIPHNPMINAGAIMSTSLIKKDEPQSNRFEYIMNYWSALINDKVGFNNAVYLSEKDTADRNFCLAYMMKEKMAFSNGRNLLYKREWTNADLLKNLELYFQTCSIECNTKQMATLASTLANGGTNVFSNQKVFNQTNVKNILSLMLSCGLYDYSGEWFIKTGIPAKSGVSGIIYTVLPGIAGIAVYSPRLDQIGNSIRGVQFFQEFSKIYDVHVLRTTFNNIGLPLTKKDYNTKHFNNYLLLEACSRGSLETVKQLAACNINLNYSDYDKRTALHLACSNNHIEIVKYLIDMKVNINVSDRWSNKPYDDAINNGNLDIAELLK